MMRKNYVVKQFARIKKHLSQIQSQVDNNTSACNVLIRVDAHISIIQSEINKINDIKLEVIKKNNYNIIKEEKTANAYECDDHYIQKIIKRGGL
jgi:hypothetical protein